MKPNFISHLVRSLLIASVFVMVTDARAQVDATAWTSVEGTTIWARLDGMTGNQVILNLRGKTYHVPMSRLAPKSIEKARRMLKLPAGKSVEMASSTRPVHKVAAATPGHARVSGDLRLASTETPIPGNLALATLPDPELANVPPPPAGPVAPPAIVGSELTPQLPAIDATADTSSDGYGAVLPPRHSLVPSQTTGSGSQICLVGKRAIAPTGVPDIILAAIEAGNRLQTKYYKWGGGRATLEDSGYDCSGSVSYVLIKAGLLRSPLHSGSFTHYGSPGRGRWITIYARQGHVFMTICGLRLDTGGHGGRGESGPRWCTHMRGTSGFVMRHPPGF